jgi:flagellar biosynthesis/type III secretory pathway protein FliH
VRLAARFTSSIGVYWNRRAEWTAAPAPQDTCLRRIAGTEMDDVQRFLLVNCVETCLELDTQETAEYEALRSREGEEGQMLEIEKLTWADKIRAEGWRDGLEQGLEKGMERGMEKGLEKGLERGKEQGARRILLRLLGLRFGPVPEAVRRRVEAIESLETLTELADRVLMARSIEDLW